MAQRMGGSEARQRHQGKRCGILHPERSIKAKLRIKVQPKDRREEKSFIASIILLLILLIVSIDYYY